MQHAARPLVQPLHVRPSQVGKPEAAARVRHCDLPGVEMAAQDEIEDARLESIDLREVAEKDEVAAESANRSGRDVPRR